MSRYSGILMLIAVLCTTGCVIVDVGVTNPNPNISTVAVAPFFNQSNEKAVDGRRFASAYFTELQKVPGYQVVPVGVTETAIIKHHLKMTSPQDALKLAKILNVDAVVVGTVTDYDPYYPPRIGLHVEWYSPKTVTFEPGIQIDPNGREQIRHSVKHEYSDPEHRRKRRHLLSKVPLIVRGQSPQFPVRQSPVPQSLERNKVQLVGLIEEIEQKNGYQAIPVPSQYNYRSLKRPSPSYPNYLDNTTGLISPRIKLTSPPDGNVPLQPNQLSKMNLSRMSDKLPIPHWNSKKKSSASHQEKEVVTKVSMNMNSAPFVEMQHSPLSPIMSYTRIFEGSDADLTATLRNYLELNGDARSGNWEATMQRSEDFIRFACHLMIREMLTLHGGEGRRRIVLKHRKYK